jgi:amidophosphoribosyltransferase
MRDSHQAERSEADMNKPTGLREACGVIGIYAPQEEVARLTFFGLYALQHRGQESAGIATTDGRKLNVHTRMGLVAQVFDEPDLARLTGFAAIGHTRYSTTGSSRVENAQPLVVDSDLGQLAVAHNGNLTNTPTLGRMLERLGIPTSTTDSEMLAHICANAEGATWLERLRATLPMLGGAFCLTLLTRDALYAVRDPLGIRPLCLGRLDSGGWVVASESCALDTIGARFIREVDPGEILRIDEHGVHTENFVTSPEANARGQRVGAPISLPMAGFPQRAACSFEHIYFARPDSVIDG